MNRKQKAIEERYRKSQDKTQNKKMTDTLIERRRKYREYFRLVSCGQLTRHNYWGADLYRIVDHDTRSATYIKKTKWDNEFEIANKAWEDYHNSPLVKALS